MDAAAPASSKSFVQSLGKAFRVLETFTATEPELTLSEVCRRTLLDSGTVFRLLTTLRALGYVDRVEETRRFRLTLKVLDLGFNAMARSDLRTIARPILRSLLGDVNQAASVGVLDGSHIVYIERVEVGIAGLGLDIRVGTRIPAPYSAIGQGLLAFLPRDDRDRVLRLAGQVKIEHPLLRVQDVDSVLDQVRSTGYALSDSLYVLGVRILAVPVLDRDGYPLAAVSVAAPSARRPAEDFIARSLEPLKAAAQKISHGLEAAGVAGVDASRVL